MMRLLLNILALGSMDPRRPVVRRIRDVGREDLKPLGASDCEEMRGTMRAALTAMNNQERHSLQHFLDLVREKNLEDHVCTAASYHVDVFEHEGDRAEVDVDDSRKSGKEGNGFIRKVLRRKFRGKERRKGLSEEQVLADFGEAIADLHDSSASEKTLGSFVGLDNLGLESNVAENKATPKKDVSSNSD